MVSDVFESSGSDESPMRFQGSSASSATVASRLHGTRSRRDSMGSSSESDLIAFNTDAETINEFGSQVINSFTKRLTELEERNMTLNDERSRFRAENSLLHERINNLEEQLSIAEQQVRDQVKEEKARSKDLMSRVEREKTLEMESLSLKYQMLEKDLREAKREADKSKEESKRMEAELEKISDKLMESQCLVEGLEEERIKLEKKFKKYREEAQQDIDSNSEMVEVLTQKTEELERTGRKNSILVHMNEMEEQLQALRMKTQELEAEKEDLQNQLLLSSVERGQNLLADAPSLADELAGGDSTQLLDALREQEICNQKLRTYINGILMRVIERHPEILEIAEKDENPR